MKQAITVGYPSHYIITADDDDEKLWLSPQSENELTLYDENPLPLDE